MANHVKILRILVVLFALSAAPAAMAQQAPQYTQYIFNELVINPAYAGSKQILNINTTYRNQWTGFEGAPTTQTLSIDGPTHTKNLGWGLHLLNDEIGVQRQTAVYANASTRIDLDHFSTLSLGVAVGASQYVFDGTRLDPGTVSEIPDAAIPQGRVSQILPDLKVGLFFNTERYYAGLSAASLIPFKDSETEIATPRRHFFLSTGYMFDLNQNIRLKPSILVKEDFRSPTGVDLNTFLLLYNRLWFGASYRTALPMFTKQEMKQLDKRNALAVIAQVYVTQKFRVGYSYDMSLTALRNYGSHEVSLGYTFLQKKYGRILTPRNL
ncbi:type IX secretion system membrane protein PorP/SprF [Pontibacter diazotrophicus]|uniref:Type IX secretion system membrane protein PorP/SprF n=1 Tax=Pontibacter diazotrophicus TaxID=1400979 RepID=A0A3D8L6S4_9BACT|nr:type IX secretion system membrane protein PorP/SprF [Pontibacter diazotrophicus]RDV13077.1 type IX secretion system membrane protein PorP/SprF [Pontibacter diazotrophicus]